MVPDEHEAPGHTSEAAAAARLLRIADVLSGTAEQQDDDATHKSASSAREKPTGAQMELHQVWKRNAAQKWSVRATRFA